MRCGQIYLSSERKSWFSNNQSHHFKKLFLFTSRFVGRVFSPTKGVLSMHPSSWTVLCSDHKPQGAPIFSFHLFLQLAPHLELAKNVFHLFSCNFRRICFGFKKPWRIFPWFLTGIPLMLFLLQYFIFSSIIVFWSFSFPFILKP